MISYGRDSFSFKELYDQSGALPLQEISPRALEQCAFTLDFRSRTSRHLRRDNCTSVSICALPAL